MLLIILMKFEEGEPNQTIATFEVDSETKFHEQVVAYNALGVYTAQHAKNPGMRARFGKLGVKIAGLQMNKQEEGKDAPIPSSTELTIMEALDLSTALREFVDRADLDIPGLLFLGNPHACNVRAVEVEMAERMHGELKDKFNIVPFKPSSMRVGFGQVVD